MCTLDYDVLVRVDTEDPRISRKEHSCLGCGTTIRKGEAYCRVFYVSDGYGHSEKECFACWWTRREFWEEHGGGPMPWALEDELRECIGGERRNPWRIHLAALRRRWRTSAPARRALHEGWFQGALNRQLRFTRRVLSKRLAP